MTKNTETRAYPVKTELAKTVIEFTSSECPTISDYNPLYADIFGQYPNVRCIIKVDENSGYQLQQDPQFTYKDGLIDTVWFDMSGNPSSGCLILSL